jgi:4-hydroxy-tetrahydrodipicolinate reductase
MIDLFIHGAGGRMGRAVAGLAALTEDVLVAGALDPRISRRETLEGAGVFDHIPDGGGRSKVVVDFTRPEAIGPLVAKLRGTGAKLVSGTTGLEAGHRDMLEEYSQEAAVLYDENMSYGVCVLRRLLRSAAALCGPSTDIEIVEFHHRAKRDHPSGTTYALARAIDALAKVVEGRIPGAGSGERVIRAHSVRMGGVPGEHNVYFATDDEVVSLSHRALSRDAFARGALRAVRFVADKTPGLYSMEDLASG